ncbi:acyltransferase [Clostridium botulinum]|uniref:Hexapeptide repeat-containing transferase n=1 Tax=Clostridium botulinum B str. Osaka05 TaxID=1407017 RepID=A0A0S6U684_CLOBO|nr:acyltransferase [Clostridium botulinum]EKO1912528.1 acyltransferase [Clostridium botulinum]EKO2042589.1 acyltransferase [Clostridium botulinum]GAE03120.1 hypothetical protein CBO05C_2810 [Clostridium botulinum B str. Osaka05]
MKVISKIDNKFRYYLNKIRCSAFGKNSYIDKSVKVFFYKGLYLGDFVSIYYNNFIMNENGKISFGNNSHIAPGGYVNCNNSNIIIGNDVAIGPQCCLIAYSNYYKATKTGLDIHTVISGDIKIGSNVFIGSNVTILPGVSIADNCVIGAGSVVNKDICTSGVYAGSPVVKIKDLNI